MRSPLILWTSARALSSWGSGLTLIAQPLVLYGAFHEVWPIALLWTVRAVASYALLPVGGILADRLDRKSLLVVSDLVSAGSVLAMALLVPRAGALLAVFLIVAGVAQGANRFFSPAAMAVFPQVSQGMDLRRANAVLSFAQQGAGLLGPAAAAVLFTDLGGSRLFGLDGLTFLLSALASAAMPISRGSASVGGLEWGVLARGFKRLGLLVFAVGVSGGVVGKAVDLLALVSSVLLTVWAMLPSLAASLAVLFLIGGALGIAQVLLRAHVQETVPSALLGRTSAALSLVAVSGGTLSILLASPLAAWRGAGTAVLVLGGAAAVLLMAAIVRGPIHRPAAPK